MALEKWCPFYLQSKAINIMAFILNHNLTKENPNATLKETFFGKQPNLSSFKKIGYAICVHVPKEN